MRMFEVMTEGVRTVSPTAAADEAWELMRRERIHHLVVTDSSGVVGVLSDRDAGGRRGRGVRTGRTVADLMSPHAVTIDARETVRKAANLMQGRTIGCLPVVDRGKLVGIVSRANLLQALAVLYKKVEPKVVVDDLILRNRIVTELKSKLWASASHINVIVHNGTVELWGGVDTTDEKKALRVATELIPGVQTVVDHIAVEKWHYGV